MRYIHLIILFLSFVLTGCNDENDVKLIDVHLLDGIWEVADQGNQDVFERNCFLNIETSHGLTNGADVNGSITTFYLTVSGIPRHDKVYNWEIQKMENHYPLLNVVFQGELDSDDIWERNYFYTITKLTDTHMWWQGSSNGDNSIIKFRRRTDIQGRLTVPFN